PKPRAMLETLLARYLGRFLKGFSPEQISARLLSGSVRLKEIELNLEAIHELLVAQLPATLELRRVRCEAIYLKVPWKRLRRKPVFVELSDVSIEAKVHSATPELLEAQARRQTESTQASEESHAVEEEEDEEDLRKSVESQLKVGLKEVIGDGVQIVVNGLQLQLWPSVSEESTPSMPLSLSVEGFQSFPSNSAGEKIDCPQDVHEFCDPCARLFRMVSVRGLRLEALSHLGGRGAVVVHDDSEGDLRVCIEQRRWCGFIPHHRSRRVCPFSSEMAISLLIRHLSLALPEAPLLAVCAAAIDLIKGIPKAAAQAPADVPQAVASWSTLAPGRGGAEGLAWREQLVSRRLVTLVTLELTLTQCEATLIPEGSASALQLKAEDFLFTLDLLNSLDAFRLRCLDELSLRDAEIGGRDSKQVCLQRQFGITLGKVAATWGGTQEGPDRRESRLLALGPAGAAGAAVTFRWKDVPALGAADGSRQPVEGCLHAVQLLLDVHALTALVDTVKNIVLPFAEILEPPPFATSWCRVRLHDLTVDLPAMEGFPFPLKLKMPSLLLTSLPGLGELFTALESLPSRHTWMGRRHPGRGERGDGSQVQLGDAASAHAGDSEPCACGRDFGSVRFGPGLAPVRGAQRPGAWAARQSQNADYVPVDNDELVEMFRAHLSARSLESVLAVARQSLAQEEGAGQRIDSAMITLSSQSPTSPRKKTSRRGWLSGLKHSFKDAHKGSSSKSGGSGRQSSSRDEARLVEAASQLASLQEAVRRLQCQREEAALRKEALQRAAEEELQRMEADVSATEEELTMQIALERGKQAELSAKAEEQRQLLTQLLRDAQAKAVRGV
ncbi:UHRF1BP1, partial [Symbiodinium natans]